MSRAFSRKIDIRNPYIAIYGAIEKPQLSSKECQGLSQKALHEIAFVFIDDNEVSRILIT